MRLVVGAVGVGMVELGVYAFGRPIRSYNFRGVGTHPVKSVGLIIVGLLFVLFAI